MFNFIWHTFFFDPIYNTLVFFIDLMPRGDVGLAIIATIIVVKVILLPLAISAAKTQKIMRKVEPRLREIKELHKEDKEAQAKEMMKIYQEEKLNPFASIALLFIQIPVVIALYFAVYNGGGVPLPEINTALLYDFVMKPIAVSMEFLGRFDIASRSIVLALLAGIAQYFYTAQTLPKLPPRDKEKAPDFKEDFTRNMHLQMKYVMPVLITVIAFTLPAMIALYFFVSNLVSILLEFYVKKHR
ncbi:MAG TPA: YidC/Oxa1 family membrane protein insertase [Candidatus Paceibacterota bacterium]